MRAQSTSAINFLASSTKIGVAIALLSGLAWHSSPAWARNSCAGLSGSAHSACVHAEAVAGSARNREIRDARKQGLVAQGEANRARTKASVAATLPINRQHAAEVKAKTAELTAANKARADAQRAARKAASQNANATPAP